jgi:hypothetical protein
VGYFSFCSLLGPVSLFLKYNLILSKVIMVLVALLKELKEIVVV